MGALIGGRAVWGSGQAKRHDSSSWRTSLLCHMKPQNDNDENKSWERELDTNRLGRKRTFPLPKIHDDFGKLQISRCSSSSVQTTYHLFFLILQFGLWTFYSAPTPGRRSQQAEFTRVKNQPLLSPVWESLTSLPDRPLPSPASLNHSHLVRP